MAVTKEKKKEIVNSLREDLSNQKAVVVVGFKGLTGEDASSMRREIRQAGAKIFITRKTLAKIAFDEKGIDLDPLSFEGEVGFVFGFNDSIETVKTVYQFIKEEKISALGGVMEGKVLSADEVLEIAKLPSREELLSKLLGTMSAPMGGFLQVLQGNIKGLLYILANAKQDK